MSAPPGPGRFYPAAGGLPGGLDCPDVDDETLERRVAEVAGRVVGREIRDPSEDLQLDSLEHAELVLAVEDAFGVLVEDSARLSTPFAVAEAVLSARSRAAGPRPALERGMGRFQAVVGGALAPVLRPYFRLSVVGAEGVPSSGPVVLASNHESLLDIPFLVIASPRPVWFMAKRELFEGRFGERVFHALGGFPVERGGHDVRAVRAALAVVRSGRVLGMYPEGTRNPEFLPFLRGAAWVALVTGAPLVPVGIRGTGEAMPSGASLPRRTHVSVAFGKAIESGRESDPHLRLRRAAEITVHLRAEVDRLRSS